MTDSRLPCSHLLSSARTQAAEESPDSVVSMKTALESRIMARRAACNEDGEEADDADDAVAVS